MAGLPVSLTEFQARIRRTILELENHARILPVEQQQSIKHTIGRFKAVLHDENVPEHKSGRSPKRD